MKFTFSSDPASSIRADVLLVPVFGRPATNPVFRQLDHAAGGKLATESRRQRFRGRVGEEVLLQTHGGLPSRHVVLVGCNGEVDLPVWYGVADATVRHCTALHARRACVFLGPLATPESVATLAEGMILARYRFDRFRSKPEEPASLRTSIAVDQVHPELRAALARGQTVAAATCFTRDLANTPAHDLSPMQLAEEARGLAGPTVKVKLRRRRDLEQLRMGALLAVGQGSQREPVLIELHYRPAVASRKQVAFVGKGITFDSGGLSLKSPSNMESQKRDMAGGAVVLGTIRAIADLGLPIEVRGYVPAAENMPGGGAIRPGDVVRAYNGKTIEVLNTDAEGRLVLADALSYAVTAKPDVLIDFATLTGAVRSALGSRYAAILGSDQDLVQECLRAAGEAGEKLWQLPLAHEYRAHIDSCVADIKNTGEGQAGTIIGGLFLREFTGEVPWAHIDFSSVVMSDGYICHPRGASGFGVRTAVRLLQNLACEE